ncbi:hypothetical protein CC86DRAFT_152298 [Ophiobolus disseminans]|uniref:Heterokaryon incompatibility domain-containing protein n=1 Tax=Ophiobolus disseminans TaxID=1469910 RepID=A0A6A6ZCR1_9PLEO|nr:hypothetical protein CC86DRAFT_152298 [Ophiobolus disseminans]
MGTLHATSTLSNAHYRHTTLKDGATFIRLIEVNMLLSTDGLIQCSISQQKLPDLYQDDAKEYFPSISKDVEHVFHSYMCLSYAWGDPKHQRKIRVNGRLFNVRKNLWNFLDIARETLYDTHLWIDALSIDQENTLERNHQVQQMGRIYSEAETVLTWLGNDAATEHVLRSVNLARTQSTLYYEYPAWISPMQRWNMRATVLKTSSSGLLGSPGNKSTSTSIPDLSVPTLDLLGDDSRGKSDILSDTTGKVEKLFESLSENEYWSRAWVTQEVLLGKSTTVVAGRQAHSLLSLASKYRAAVPYFKESAFENLIDLVLLQQRRKEKLSRIRLDDMGTGLEEWSVIQLLRRFRNKKCAIRRDRIYSLLALSNEAKALEVDYSTSEEQVMRQILALRESSMCFCSAAIASHALAPWEFPACDQAVEKHFAELHMHASTLSSATCRYCSNWVPFSWTRKKGLVFCLRTACLDTNGHIFWELPDAVEHNAAATLPSLIPGYIHVQLRQNNKSQHLCDNKTGVSIVQSQWEHVYMLRFTLRMLTEILREGTTTGDPDLNACVNLWPNDSNQPPSDEARLRLCNDT